VPRQVIGWFGDIKEEKLQENDHKVPWTDYDFDYLLLRLGQEIEELKEALEDPLSPNDVIKECADVSNFSMFIADKIHQMKNNPGWGDRGE
jgi:hypothetical protein